VGAAIFYNSVFHPASCLLTNSSIIKKMYYVCAREKERREKEREHNQQRERDGNFALERFFFVFVNLLLD